MNAPKAFVAGWPIGHSRSPLIHRFWLKRHGIAGDYNPEAVPPEEADAFFRSLAARGYAGGNVTMPLKEAAFRASSRATPVAERLGMANTLWLEDGRLHCDNTDCHGFAANLDDWAPEWRHGSNALVIGAGGAAHAVVLALIDAGFTNIVVLNRTAARAVALADHFGAPVQGGGLDELPAALAAADLVVNASSAGMAGAAGLPIGWDAARRDTIATDLVYVPLRTPFLAGAAERGLKIVDGLGMLLHQAAPGFERWFGMRPTVDTELRRIVVADLER